MNTLQLFRLISMYHLRRYRLRTFFVMFMVTVGTLLLFIALQQIANRSAGRAWSGSILAGHIDLDIRSDDGRLTTETLARLQNSAGVETAAPLIISGAFVLGKGDMVGVWGVDTQIDKAIRSYVLTEGVFPTQISEVVIGAEYALARNFTVGDSLNLVSAGGARNYAIVGLLARQGVGALNGGDIVVMAYDEAFGLTNTQNFSNIGVVAKSDISHADLQTELQSILGADISVENPAARYEKTVVDYVVDWLTFISNSIPALLGSLMITSTMSAALAQRRKEIAVLRSLGMTRQRVQGIFVVEAFIMGAIGALVGLLLGAFTMTSQASTVQLDGLETAVLLPTPLWVYVVAFLLGTGIAVCANWIPARRTSEVDPTEAMRQPAHFADTQRYGAFRIVAGIGLIALALAAKVGADNTPAVPLAVLTSILGSLAAMILLFPPIMVWVSNRIPTVMARMFGFSGLLASDNLAKRHRRAVATGLLALVITWFWAMGVAWNDGAVQYTQSVITHELQWDLLVAGPGQNALKSVSAIPSDVITYVVNHGEIETVVRERYAKIMVSGTPFTIRAVDMDTFGRNGGKFLWEYGDEAVALADMAQHQPTMLIGGFAALTEGLRQPGKSLVLNTPSGAVTFAIAGSIHTSSETIVMDYTVYSHLFEDRQVDRLLVKVKSNADVSAIRREMMGRYALSGIYVADRAELLATVGDGSNGTQFVGVALMPFMIVGIANMLFIAVLDRQREIGMLRAMGSLRYQVTWSIILESVLLVGAACLVAVPAVYFSVETMLFGRITGVVIHPNWLSLCLTIAGILLVAALAAYVPARQAGRIDILDALRYE